MKPSRINPMRLSVVAAMTGLLCAADANAANGTWTNAPADSSWTNVLNWIGSVPGTINNTGNNGVDGSSIATFTNPIPASLIGSASNPIIPDDGTIVNGKARMLSQLNFDGADCGAYVFSTLSAFQPRTATQPETGVISLCIPTTKLPNGSFIGASVATPQVFLIPVQIRLPSSTTAAYGFTNNATSPNATYYFDKMWLYPDATTRACTFLFAGSNTGTNTVAYLSESTNPSFSAACGVRKEGSGTWILSGANTLKAATPFDIAQGTLVVKDPASLGASGNVNVSNAVLQIDGITPNQMSINLRNGGNIRANGTLSLNGVAVGNQTGTSATLSTTSSGDVFTVGTGIAAGAFVTGGAVDSVLNTAGPGTLVFSQANTYVGKWSFGATSNQISSPSALGTGANVNVAAGAVLDLTPLGAAAFAPTTAGFGGSGVGTVVGSSAATVILDPSGSLDLTGKNINLTLTPSGSSGDTAHPALYIAQGALTLSGNTFFINNASGSPLGVGTYRLIQQASGNITSGGGYAALISGSGAVNGTSAAINVSNGNVDLVISLYVPKDLVWTGGNTAVWNLATDASWLSGTTPSVFNNSDVVTFNSVGSTNPSVTLSGTLAPANVTVDTGANDYTFSGAGQIAGATGLTKKGAGVLSLGNANTYAGGTVVSNGTLRIAVNNAIPSVGSGNVAVYGAGAIDLNNLSDSINGLNGDGSVDNQGGGAGSLTLGNNDATGSFTGTIKNTSGTLAITKLGNGTQTLTAANTYSGGTTLSAGTLVSANPHALGTGGNLTVDGGTLDMQTDLYVNSLAGAGGTVANNSTATTNTLVVQGTATTAYNGTIVDGASGKVGVKVLGGTLRLNGVNAYTGGTVVGAGSTFQIGGGGAVGGDLIASNGVTLGMPSGSNPPGTPASITTADGAMVSFTSGAEGNIWSGQFIGGATATNQFTQNVSAGGDTSFANFQGVVQFALTSGNFRFFRGGGVSGGDNTTFEFISGNVHTRDAQTVRLGAIRGGTPASGIGGQGVNVATYMIGGKNTDSLFHGYFNGSNNLVKIGSGKLTFDGANIATNTDGATYTNYVIADTLVAFVGSTTISNGTLALVVPNNLSNATSITLAAPTAVLDASQMGYVSNFTDAFGDNSFLVTNGVFELQPLQTLSGVGTINGILVADAGSTVTPGLPTGTLAVSGSATLNGAVSISLNRTNIAKNGALTASSITASGALTVTNLGPDLVTGDTFALFNHPVAGFATINLPVQNADGSITYQWQNNIATDGTIKVLSGASAIATNPTNITFSVGANQLTLTWPGDHLGWKLQSQTNALSTGLTTNWYDVPGSTTVTQMIMTVSPADPTVFYRLMYQVP